MDRREFLKWSGLGLAGATARGAGRPVAIEVGKDSVAQSAPVQWAIGELKKVVTVRADAPLRIGVMGVPEGAGGAAAESFGLIPGGNMLVVRATDPRGLVYGITELARRAGQENFGVRERVLERPANPVRSVTRCFVSDVEDKPWYNDRAMWPEELGMLVANRFNRFSL